MLWLIALPPFVAFVVNAFLGRRFSKRVSGGLACAAMFMSFGAALAAFLRMTREGPFQEDLFTWIASGDLVVPLSFRVDPLGGLMILVVTGIGSLIHVYSTAYMHDEPDSEYARYFSYLNLFAAFMLVLVLGANFVVMFVGWEGVGLCSYLLIGFWFKKQSAADAGKKAFIVNRIGDFGFILGMLLTFNTFGTLDFQQVAAEISRFSPEPTFGVLSLIALLLFIGATGKSAQIPLYVWLPDAMEGPTPVSALIHAATMVTAGVYMIGRNAVLYEHAPVVLVIVGGIGVATALMAGTIGLVQNDIKRVLAYSTVSQLGLMFLAMGVGAFAAGIFHLYTHAFFKALLFLGSGAVIHALAGEQDLRRMGGLKKDLPITYWTFLIGSLAIAGVPLLSGFFSKDEILYRTFLSGHWIYYLAAALTSLLTATYMFRLVFMAFHGHRADSTHDTGTAAPAHREEEEPAGRGVEVVPVHAAHDDLDRDAVAVAAHGMLGHHAHVHDAPPAMAIPLIVLAIGSVVAGYVGVPHALGGENRIERFLHPSFTAPTAGAQRDHVANELHSGETDEAIVGRPVSGQHASGEREEASGVATGNETLELSLMGVSVAIAFIGIGIAAFLYLRSPDTANRLAQQFSGLHRLLSNKYYVDEMYDNAVVQPIKIASRDGLWRGVDASVIDGTVNGIGLVVRGSAAALRRVQSGSIRTYAAALFLGAVLTIGYYLFR